MIQAVFWDYDNTILETAEAHWHKHRIVLDRHGIELSEKFRSRIYENNGQQNWEWMKDELNLAIPLKDYLVAIDCEFQKQIKNLKLRSGVAELLDFFHALGIPQAIITNARRSSVEPILEEKQLLSFMQFLLCSEDYDGRKPDPAPYLEGFKKMSKIVGQSFNPKRCLAIEDDPIGVKSAHQAGAIVIHRKLNANDFDCPYAHYSCFEENDFIKTIRKLIDFQLPKMM